MSTTSGMTTRASANASTPPTTDEMLRQLLELSLKREQRDDVERQEQKREKKERAKREKEEREDRDAKHAELLQAILALAGSRSDTPISTAVVNDPKTAAKPQPDVAAEPDVAIAPVDEPTIFSAPAFSAKRDPNEFSKPIRELQLDFDWYAANGYHEGCKKPVDERLVALLFPPLTPGTTTFGNETYFDAARNPKDRVSDMPTFTSSDDSNLAQKILQAQVALSLRSIPIAYWASYVAPRLQGDFDTLSTGMTTRTPWYRCVFAIICVQGLQIYGNHREQDLCANVLSNAIIADTSALAKAYALAPLLVIDGQGRLDTFISRITAWDQRMGGMLRDRLLVLLPDRVVDGPRGYTLALRDLSSFARQQWTAFASALDAAPRLRTAAPPLVAASSLTADEQNSDNEYFSDGGTVYHDQAFVTAFEKKRQRCFNCKKQGHWARDCTEPKTFKTINSQKHDRSFSRPAQSRGMSRSRQDRPALGRAVTITGNLTYNDKPSRVFAVVDDPVHGTGDNDDSDARSDSE